MATAKGDRQGAGGDRQGRTRRASHGLAAALTRALDPLARKRGFAAASLFADWATIVGPGLARRCQPASLEQPRGGRGGGVLVLHAAGAAALELQHAAPQILERINGHFGFRAVRQLRLLQVPLPQRRPDEAEEARALDPGEAAAVAAVVAPVTDPGLRDALASLGQAIKAARPTPARPCRPKG